MPQKTYLNGVRGKALDRIEKSERNYKLAILIGVLVEGLFFVGFFLLADFKNPLHLLLLISTVAAYSIIIIGLIALGAHVNRATLMILKAIELLEEKANAR